MNIKRDLVFSYISQAWIAIIGLVLIPLYIRYLGVEAYGLIGLFTVINAWLSLLDMGMSPTLEREMARFTADMHSGQSIRTLLYTIEVIAFIVSALIALFTWTSAGWIGNNWLRQGELPINIITNAISITGIVIGLRFFESIYRSALLGLQQQAWVSIWSAILQTLRHGGAAIVLILISPTIGAFFLWQGVISFITIVVYAVKVHNLLPNIKEIKAQFSIKAIKDIWHYAGGVIGITVLALLLTQTDKILLSRLLSLTNFGYYTISSILTGMMFTAIGPIIQTIYPRLVKLQSTENQESFTIIFHQGAQIITVIIVPFLTLAMLFPQEILFVWIGDQNVAFETAPILMPMAFGSFLNCLMWMPSRAQFAFGWTSLELKMNLALAVILVPAIFLIVPIYGAIGAAWIWVILNCGYVIVGAQLMFKKIMTNEMARWYLDDLARPIIAALATGLLLSEISAPFFEKNERIALAIQLVLVAFAVFFAAAFTANQLHYKIRALLVVFSVQRKK